MLDLVFSESDKDLILGVDVDDICVISPVHMFIKFKLKVTKNLSKEKGLFLETGET